MGEMTTTNGSTEVTPTMDELRKLFSGFFESIGRRLSPTGLQFWVAAFADLKPQQVREALLRFSRESTEFPSPAAVRKYAGLAGLITAEDRSDVAWRVVRRCISSIGGYESVDFDDPAINAAIRDIGGWVQLCDTPTSDLTWKEKDFKRAYGSVVLTGAGHGDYLPGIQERTNSRLGHSANEAVRITTGLEPANIPRTSRVGLEDKSGGVRNLVASVAGNLGVVE